MNSADIPQLVYESYLWEHRGADNPPFFFGVPQPIEVDGITWSKHDKLGKGGFGQIFRAVHDLHGELAVKIQLIQEKTKGYPQQEAAVLWDIDHPNVIEIIGEWIASVLGRDNTVYTYHYMGLPLAPGGSLVDLDAKEGVNKHLPIRKVLLAGHQIACGLSAMHAKGWVHRDIKPDNVLCLDEENFILTVADPGLVAKLDEQGLAAGIAGTHGYIPLDAYYGYYGPEFDLFSLGVTIFALIENGSPFRPSQRPHMECAIKRLRTGLSSTHFKNKVWKEIPALRTLIEECLLGKPEERGTASWAADYFWYLYKLASGLTTEAEVGTTGFKVADELMMMQQANCGCVIRSRWAGVAAPAGIVSMPQEFDISDLAMEEERAAQLEEDILDEFDSHVKSNKGKAVEVVTQILVAKPLVSISPGTSSSVSSVGEVMGAQLGHPVSVHKVAMAAVEASEHSLGGCAVEHLPEEMHDPKLPNPATSVVEDGSSTSSVFSDVKESFGQALSARLAVVAAAEVQLAVEDDEEVTIESGPSVPSWFTGSTLPSSPMVRSPRMYDLAAFLPGPEVALPKIEQVNVSSVVNFDDIDRSLSKVHYEEESGYSQVHELVPMTFDPSIPVVVSRRGAGPAGVTLPVPDVEELEAEQSRQSHESEQLTLLEFLAATDQVYEDGAPVNDGEISELFAVRSNR